MRPVGPVLLIDASLPQVLVKHVPGERTDEVRQRTVIFAKYFPGFVFRSVLLKKLCFVPVRLVRSAKEHTNEGLCQDAEIDNVRLLDQRIAVVLPCSAFVVKSHSTVIRSKERL